MFTDAASQPFRTTVVNDPQTFCVREDALCWKGGAVETASKRQRGHVVGLTTFCLASAFAGDNSRSHARQKMDDGIMFSDEEDG